MILCAGLGYACHADVALLVVVLICSCLAFLLLQAYIDMTGDSSTDDDEVGHISK